jgi:hypothetical protein
MPRFGHVFPVFPSTYHRRVASVIANVLALVLLSAASLAAQQITPANVVSPDGWAWQNPFPQGNDLNGVWGNPSATDIFAVGNFGTVIHYDGKTWSGTSVNANTLYAVWGSFLTSPMNLRPDDVYAVGANGAIIHYDGTGWTSMSSPTQKDLHGIWGSWPSDIYAVGAGGTILLYNGTAWTQVTSNTEQDLYAVWGRSPGDVYAVGAGATIMHYDGTSWTSATDLSSNETLVGMSGSLTTSELFVVGAEGSIWQFDGTSWNSNSVNTYPFYGVWFNSATEVVAVGGGAATGNSTIWRFNGSEWNNDYAGDQDLHAVWASSSSGAIYAVGAAGTILYDNGSGWGLVSSDTANWNYAGPPAVQPTPDNFYAVGGSSPSEVFVAGFNPSGVDCAYFPQYNGSVWNWNPFPSSCPLSYVYRGLWVSSATDAFAVGGSALAHFNGTEWGSLTTAAGLSGVWGSTSRNSSGRANDVYAAGSGGALFYYNGTAWSSVTSNTTNQLNSLWGSLSVDFSGHANDVFAVGAGGVILHYDGTGWKSMASGAQTNLYSVWGSSSSDVYAVGAGGTLLHYDGFAWSALTSTTTNDLDGVWGTSSTNVYAAGANGTILHYDGTSSKSMNSGTQRNLNAVWGSSATDVFAVGDSGTILNYQPPTVPNNPVPATTGVSPSTVPYSLATFTITVTGSNFVSGSLIYLNSLNLPTTYLSATQLTAAIQPANSAMLAAGITWAAGTFNLTVFNPMPGGGTSNPQTLTVTPAATALSVPAVSGTYQGTVTLSAVLTANGPALPNKAITFTINGISVGTPVATDSSGTVTLTVSLACIGGTWITGTPPYPPCIDAGTYPSGIAASFAGDSNYPGRNGTATLSLNQIPTQISLPNASFVTGQSVTLTATLTATTPTGSNPLKVDEGQVVFQTPNGALTSTVFEGLAAVVFTPPPSAIGPFPITATFSSTDFGTSSGTSTLSISSFTADLAITSLTIAPLAGANNPQWETVTVQASNLGPATAEGVTVALMLRDYKGNPLSTVATWVIGEQAANTPVVESTTVDLTTVALGSQYYATVSSLYGVDNYPWNNSAILILSAVSFDLTNGDAGFSVARNGLPFPNRSSESNVTWDQFEATFGYNNVGMSSCPTTSSECTWVHSPKAQWFYDGLYNPWFQGNCYGMSAYALNEWVQFPSGSPGGTSYLFNQFTDPVWYQTEILQGTALGGQVLTQEAAEAKLDPNTVLAALQAQMANRIGSIGNITTGSSSNPIILMETTGTSNNPGALYAHAVVPYLILETQTVTTNELNQITMNYLANIYVYDPNYPYDPNNRQQSLRFITIDPVKNTWTDPVTNMGGNTGLLYIPSSLNAEQPPALPYATNNSSTTPPTDVVITTGEASTVLDTIIDGVQDGIGVDLTPVSAVVDGVLTIVGWAENINGNSVATDVEDGLEVASDILAIVIWFCLDPISASGPPPEAYLLSAGHQYTATLYGTGTGSATLNMLKSASGLRFTSQSMTQATRDSITYSADGSTASLATNATTESYAATMLQDVSSSVEEEVAISNTAMAAGDNITLAYLNNGAAFQIINQGGPKSYDLNLQTVGSGAGQVTFAGLNMNANETHVFTPSDWTNLGTAPVNLQITNSQGTTSGTLVAPAITSAGTTSFTYGTGGTFTVTATGFPQPLLTESGTLPSGVSVNLQTGVLSVAPSSPAGVYPMSLTAVNSLGGSPAQNFTLTVNPAPLTIKVDNQTISYGALLPALTASYSGFVNGDASGVLNGALSCRTTATASSPAGTYPITCSGQTSTNYVISYLSGQLSITQSSWNGGYALLVGSAGGTSSIMLAFAGAWTATANDSFLHLSPGSASGTGSAVVVFTYDAFPATGSRTGTLTIAGLTVTVTQAGVNYLAPGPVITLVSSGLNHPVGVAVDGSGDVYIADYGDNAIKEWSASTQQATTLVSSGLSGPFGVAVDGSGNVYIGDYLDSAIKEWSASTQQLTALVPSGLSHPAGVAVDASGNVYIADDGDSAIKEWSASTQRLATLVSSGLSGPAGVAVDAFGNVYIGDTGNAAMKEWNALTLQVTTLAPGQSGPREVAVDGSGNVYIANFGGDINVWNASTQQVTTLATLGPLGRIAPWGVAVDGADNVYIADYGNSAIEEIPCAFVGPASLTEPASAGADSLLPVLPSTTSLTGIFAPTSDQSWLTIGPIANGVIDFSFTANTSISRVAHITLLGQRITITQNGSAAPQTIAFATLADQPLGTAPFTVGATASSGLAVILTSKTTSVCTVSGSQVTLLAVGTCTIEADQTGNADYAAATPVTRSFQVTGSSCDIGHGGSTTVGDVQHIVNEALGLLPPIDDLNGDGMVGAVEVQIVINAALSLGCTTR